ncbi:MAG: hypothetical protein Ta2F_17140 [Termitinemataceae bacterium]|nr:MAG: hypothetical protein Ta2F_17140 [Termitinemataceae bacterium]
MLYTIFISKTFQILPLQSTLKLFEIKDDPKNVIAFVVIIVIAVAAITFMARSKKFQQSSIMQQGKLSSKKSINVQKVTSDFWPHAAKYSLTKREASILEHILKKDGDDPVSALKDIKLLDEQFKRYIQELDRSGEDDNLNEIAEVFAIRNAIDFFISSAQSKKTNKAPRSHRRKNIDDTCYITEVDSVKDKSGTKKLVLTNRKCEGNFINISLGGCAIQPEKSLKVGRLIKIDCSIKRQRLGVLGQILRINVDGRKSIIHIKYLKITKKAQNIINSLIFNY